MRCRLCFKEKPIFIFSSKNRHGRKLLSQEEFDLYRCPDCDVIFTDIEPDGTYYTKYYPKDYYSSPIENNFFLKKIFHFLRALGYRQKIRLIKKFHPTAKKVLEIGCGVGEFLGFLSGSLDRYGVEINPEAHDFLRRTHPEIHFSAVGIESDDFLFKDLKFDVIILSHVFEHIAKPKEFVLKLSYLLDKKGIILMDIPNSQSFGFTKTQKFWFHLDVPRHLFFYSRKTLEPFLKEYGLNVCYFGASALDYFQDLAVSFYMKNKNTATILNALVLIVFFPIFIFIRSVVALCAPQYAEINTYVIEKLGILKK